MQIVPKQNKMFLFQCNRIVLPYALILCRKKIFFTLEISLQRCYTVKVNFMRYGELAQPVRALASHARGQQFESAILHQQKPLLSKAKEVFVCIAFVKKSPQILSAAASSGGYGRKGIT